MEFNFPGLGKALVDTLRNLLPEMPSVQDLAVTNHSVGGFVCEKLFIKYINTDAHLQVIINSLQGQAAKNMIVNLSIDAILTFEGKLLKGVLYELYSFHPAIDFVGYILSCSQSNSVEFLICMQISLSRYIKHDAKLSNIIRAAPKKCFLSSDEPTNMNMLQFYSSRANHYYKENSKPKVLFLYISPYEDERLIPTLQEEMMTALNQYSVSFDFYVGVAPRNSLDIFRPFMSQNF